MTKRFTPLFVSSVLLLVAQMAGAQPAPRYALVPVTRNDERLDLVLQLAREAEAALTARGETFVPLQTASALFARNHSREPATWDQSDVDRLAAASRKALEAIVAGDYKEALAHTREARQRVDGAIEVINRRLEWSKLAFRACAMEVRGRYEERDQQGAFDAAVRCRTLYPGFEPDPSDHPKDVRDIFTRAQKEIRRTRTQTLIVDSRPAGCNVVLNGRSMGITPFRQQGLAAHEPRLQVECAGARGHGRVHIVPSGPEVTMFIDADFEAAVRTDGDLLRLVYDEHQHDRLREHSVQVARALGVAEVLAFASPAPGQLHIMRFTASSGRTVSLPAQHEPWEVDRALSELTGASPESPVMAPPQAARSEREPPASPERRRRALLATGGVALGLGVAASVTGWVLFRQRLDEGTLFRAILPTDPEYLERQGAWLEHRDVTYALAASAAGLGTAGGVLLERGLPKRPPRWWRWSSLAIGGALATSGIVLAALGNSCDTDTRADRRDCVIDQHRLDRGAFLILTGAPLLLTPAASWLRDKVRGDVRLDLRASRPASASLRVSWPL